MAKRVRVGGVTVTPIKKPRGFGRSPRGRLRPRRLNARTAGFLGIERKFADFETGSDTFGTSWATMQDGTIKCISAVAVGNTESTRVGRVYNITSLHLRGSIETNPTESDTAPLPQTSCRVAIVWDTQTNAAELTPSAVFDEGQSDNFLAFRNLQNTKRFRILMDKMWVIRPDMVNEGAQNLFAANAAIINWKFNRTFKKPIKVICSGTSAVIGSITDNSIHVIGVCNQTTTSPRMQYQARIRFTG